MKTSQALLPLLLLFGLFTPVEAADTAAELLPPTTLFYAEVKDPSALVNSFLEHPYFAQLQELEPYQELLKQPQYLQGMFALRFVEAQLGMTWREGVSALSAGGVTIAFDPATEGFAVFFKGENEENLNKVVDKIVELVRNDAEEKGKDDPYEIKEYRGLEIYTMEGGGFLTHGNWLIAGNNSELGRQLVDALLDGREDSFADNEQFQQARQKMGDSAIAWAYLDLETLRHSGDEKLEKLFTGKTENPGAELIVGGIAEVLVDASHVTASLDAQGNGLSLNLQLPHDPESTSELREHFFGPQGTGQAAPLQEIPDMLFGLTAYRNVSEMWLRSGDLFNEQVNDGLAEADSNLSTFFSGKDFGEDILGVLAPQMQIIATRQTYAEDQPIPAIKIPAFALVAEMEDPETTTREFRRIFHSFIGFFNVIGAMNGQPQFDLGFDKFDGGDLVSATPIPLDDADRGQAKINFNFSPTIAFAGKRLVISSATGLAKLIAEAEEPTASATRSAEIVNTNMVLSAPQLQLVLEDNRSHLIAQNMLEDGNTREEAEQQIGIFLEALKLFQEANLSLTTGDSSLKIDLGIELNE